MREDIVKIAKDILYEVQTQEISFNTKWGICVIMEDRIPERYEPDVNKEMCMGILESVFETWEHFSGLLEYPVPSTDKHYYARQAYNHFKLWEGEQLKLRIDLLKHIIKELEK